jgi:CheY-like chemotaxis protein
MCRKEWNVRIGLLEDNPTIVELLTFMLEREYTVIAYCSGAAFLRALNPGPEVPPPFDLAVIDLGLPDMPGVEVISTVRLSPATRRLPIIVLSGAPPHLLAQVTSRFPDIPIVRKPFHFEDLLGALESLMVVAVVAEHAKPRTEGEE